MRKHYLDNIRWITVVLVVLYHVLYMYNAEGILGGLGQITTLKTQYYDLFLYFVYPWFMPILFIVSGMCARYTLGSHSEQSFIKSRTRKLLVPSTIGLVTFHFIQGYINVSLGDGFATMQTVPLVIKIMIVVLSGGGVLWFIQLLWVLSMLLVIIRRLEKDRLWNLCTHMPLILVFLLVLPLWVSAQLLNMPVITVYRFGFYCFFFLIGYFVFSHDEVIDQLKTYCLPIILIALVTGIAFCLVFFKQNYADAPVNRTLLYALYAWLGCLAMLGGMARFGDITNPFANWMNKHSFGLYVFHYLGISAVALFIAKPGLLPAPIVYALSLIAGFGGGFLLNALISRIPVLRWCVLGIQKKRT